MAGGYPDLEESIERIIMDKQTHLLRRPEFWLGLAAGGISTWSLFSQNYGSAVWIVFFLLLMQGGLSFAHLARVKFGDLTAGGPKLKFPRTSAVADEKAALGFHHRRTGRWAARPMRRGGERGGLREGETVQDEGIAGIRAGAAGCFKCSRRPHAPCCILRATPSRSGFADRPG